jgi:APA family basic amino acid/polyamine antiporter
MKFLKKKDFDTVKEVSQTSGLEKTLGPVDLILLGLGAIVGTGVFALTGMVAAQYSGPAITLSYMIAGITCIFVALAYTELATMLPTSGSVYTYTYVALGEVFAWIMGSVIIIELGFGAATVASSWSSYTQRILKSAGIDLPDALSKVPAHGGIIDLPAFLIVAFVWFVLYLGTKESKKLNRILVLVKMTAIFIFIVVAAPSFDAANWENFMPYGFDDVLVGSSILFFAFTGFGVIASTAEECKNPKRDLTIGIIGSLIISTLLYVIVAGIVTGIVPFTELNNAEPLAHALFVNGNKIGPVIVATGAVFGMTTVIMMNLYGQSRIFYVMSRDGLLPKFMSKLHPKYDSPYITLLIFAGISACLGAFCPIKVLGQLSSMGSLIDYIVVVLIVIIFRFKLPNAERPFKCPIVYIIAPATLIALTILLFKQILGKNGELLITGKILICWFVIVFILYVIRMAFIKRTDNIDSIVPDKSH